jgi:hypothetical protein
MYDKEAPEEARGVPVSPCPTPANFRALLQPNCPGDGYAWHKERLSDEKHRYRGRQWRTRDL